MKNMKSKRKLKILSLVLVVVLLVNNLTFSVSEAKTKVKLNKTKVILTIGNTTELILKNTKSKPKWSSSKKSVATVNSRGDVIAKNAGKTKITAKLGKKKYTCNVTVPKQYISASSLTIQVDENKPIEIHGVSFDDSVYWYSDDNSIASVSEDGIITGRRSGQTNIYGKINKSAGKKYKCVITVIDNNLLTSVPTINPEQTNVPTSTLAPTSTPKPMATLTPEPIIEAPSISNPSNTVEPTALPIPTLEPTFEKQILINQENVRYEKEVSEIKTKYDNLIMDINDEINYIMFSGNYYYGTITQYQSEISYLTNKISSIEKQLAVLSGDNNEEIKLKISKLLKELQEYKIQLSELEEKWSGKTEVDMYTELLETTKNQRDMELSVSEENHKRKLEEIYSLY